MCVFGLIHHMWTETHGHKLVLCEDSERKAAVCLFIMKHRSEGRVVESDMSQCCGFFCLGPLTFHSQVVGEKVRLSHDCRLAERTGDTFRNGLVFSSRPIKVQERVTVSVERDSLMWDGGLRVGFTNIPPSSQPLPLPCTALPNLNDRPGHWVGLLHESISQAGSVLTFWVSRGGAIYVKHNNNSKHCLLTGVDISQPLWAVIDIYGQTQSIFLHGSEKKGCLVTYRSCPAPEPITSSYVDKVNSSVSAASLLGENTQECKSSHDVEIPLDERCVVCLESEARVVLTCGHRCLCPHCAVRVFHQFGTCPLCRQEIS